MKTRLNGAGILALACVLLSALALVCVSCTGGTGTGTDPGVNSTDPGSSSTGSGGGSSGTGSGGVVTEDDGPVTESPAATSKPAKLTSSATADQALAKLNEIIAYPGTPSGVKADAQYYKNYWSGYSAVWSSVSFSVIPTINAMIDNIP
jgi:hypothetical protein